MFLFGFETKERKKTTSFALQDNSARNSIDSIDQNASNHVVLIDLVRIPIQQSTTKNLFSANSKGKQTYSEKKNDIQAT